MQQDVPAGKTNWGEVEDVPEYVHVIDLVGDHRYSIVGVSWEVDDANNLHVYNNKGPVAVFSSGNWVCVRKNLAITG
jgi:hypothetical protein